MSNKTRKWRSAIAMVLVICMLFSIFPTAAFAEDATPIKYVSLGASNTNGYGLRGYIPAADGDSDYNETMNEAETKALFGYDNVISYDSESFYATTGDTTDFYYRLKDKMGADTTLFSTCFEFGTIGDSFLDSIISMKYTIEENQNHWYPTTDKIMNEIVKERYQELFYPTEMEWREKTVADFAAAAKGVLNAKLIAD